MPVHVDSWLDMDALPSDCIAECSGPGDVFDAVEFWRDELGFTVNEEKARRYIRASGAYTAAELAAKVAEDSTFLARWILWSACCEFAEAQACIADGESEGDLSSGSTCFCLDA